MKIFKRFIFVISIPVLALIFAAAYVCCGAEGVEAISGGVDGFFKDIS